MPSPKCTTCKEPQPSVYHMQRVSDNFYCMACWRTLPECRACRRRYLTVDSNRFCEGCARYYTVCGDCDAFIDHNGECRGCMSRFMRGDAKERSKLKAAYRDSSLVLGWELEVELKHTSNKMALLRAASRPWLTIQHDGSLRNGLEFASQPMTWNWLKANEADLKAWLTTLGENCKSYDTTTCGIHVHIDRRMFKGDQLYRFMHFIYRNPGFVHKVSQRTKGKLDQWASLKVRRMIKVTDSWSGMTYTTEGSSVANPEPETLKEKAQGRADRRKYAAVNTSRPGTIEVRIFRGTLSPQTFLKNLEFIHAAYTFSQQTDKLDRIPTAFRKFVSSQSKEYPNLHGFLKNPAAYNTDQEVK